MNVTFCITFRQLNEFLKTSLVHIFRSRYNKTDSKNRRHNYGKFQPYRQFAFIYHKRFLFWHLCIKAQYLFCYKYTQDPGGKRFFPCFPVQAGLQYSFYRAGLSRISFLDGIPDNHRRHRVLRGSAFLFFQRMEKLA